MKKLIALILSLTLVLAFLPSCGAINKNEVAVLWSDYNDEYLFTIADAFDRAAYIENIKYTHEETDELINIYNDLNFHSLLKKTNIKNHLLNLSKHLESDD